MEKAGAAVQAVFAFNYDDFLHNMAVKGAQVRIDPKLAIEFAAIAEEGSFTRAAQRLRVAQPWLSARLHKLEDILGFQLLERTTRRVSLTDLGAEFFQAARGVAEASAAAERLALQLRRTSKSVLRVGAAPYTKIIRQRRELIDGFARSHADVHLELETGWSHPLMDRLDAGEIDLSFIMGDCWPSRFQGVVLKHHGVALTLSRDHPLAAKRSLPPEAVADRPILVYTRSLYPELWDALYAPFIVLGAQFIEVPEMAEGPPSRMRSPDDVAAFFDFGGDDAGTADVVRIPVESSVAIPFQLTRRTTELSRAASDFWELAKAMAR